MDDSTQQSGLEVADDVRGGWVAVWDPASQQHYYAHTETHETRWDEPVQDAKPGGQVVQGAGPAQAVAEHDDGVIYFTQHATLLRLV